MDYYIRQETWNLKTDEKLLPGTEGVLHTCRQNAALLFLLLYILTTWMEVDGRRSDIISYCIIIRKKHLAAEKWWQLLKVVALGLLLLLQWDLAYQYLSVCKAGDCTHEDQS